LTVKRSGSSVYASIHFHIPKQLDSHLPVKNPEMSRLGLLPQNHHRLAWHQRLFLPCTILQLGSQVPVGCSQNSMMNSYGKQLIKVPVPAVGFCFANHPRKVDPCLFLHYMLSPFFQFSGISIF